MMWRSYLLLIYHSCCSVEMKSLGSAQQLYTCDKLQVSCLSTQTESQATNHKYFAQVANNSANPCSYSLTVLHTCFIDLALFLYLRYLMKKMRIEKAKSPFHPL